MHSGDNRGWRHPVIKSITTFFTRANSLGHSALFKARWSAKETISHNRASYG